MTERTEPDSWLVDVCISMATSPTRLYGILYQSLWYTLADSKSSVRQRERRKVTSLTISSKQQRSEWSFYLCCSSRLPCLFCSNCASCCRHGAEVVSESDRGAARNKPSYFVGTGYRLGESVSEPNQPVLGARKQRQPVSRWILALASLIMGCDSQFL